LLRRFAPRNDGQEPKHPPLRGTLFEKEGFGAAQTAFLSLTLALALDLSPLFQRGWIATVLVARRVFLPPLPMPPLLKGGAS